jgi:acyl-CoA synthetase (AMP-forming)/AMP-acid ligase II
MALRVPRSDESLAELIFGWAERTPDKTAVVINGRPIGYRAFADQIAVARGFFARRGWTGEGVVVLAIADLLGFWVVSLALRSLGLTTIAMTSAEAIAGLDLPEARGVVCIAGQVWQGLEAVSAARGLPLVAFVAVAEAPLDFAAPPPSGPGGNILRTSATTGAFKLVLIEPAFEVEFLPKRLVASGLTEASVVNLFAFGGWTGGGYKTSALPWMVGATIVIDQRRPFPLPLLQPGLTLSLMVPEMLDAVLAAPEGSYPRSETMWLSVTGGGLTQAQINAAKARITPLLFSGLGATETAAFGFTPLETPDDQRWHQLVDGVPVEIVDDLGRPVPPGVVGRLRVSSAGGPTRYLHDDAASREFFRDGFFYPGDLAMIREDGRIALQGRVTAVINVRGHKISPEPIELQLKEGLGVKEVCLFSMPDAAGEEEIHVIIETPAALAPDRLVAGLRQALSGFPHAQVHYTTSLPRNAMGKVLRQAAREQALARFAG